LREILERIYIDCQEAKLNSTKQIITFKEMRFTHSLFTFADCLSTIKKMSDALEKVSGIKHLPLFPLPLVLLPNELLPLHIFEARYRRMLEDVALGTNMFGVSYFNPADNFIEKPATGSVGCVAEVREAQTLPDGRSNILTIGVIRYRLIDYIDASESYLLGDVEFFEDEKADETTLNPLADEVFTLFRRIALAAHKLSGERGTFPDVSQTEPEALSFLVTAAVNLEPDLKYQLLETRSTIERLKRLREILVQAVGKMEESAEIHKIAKTNGHSKKKIDI
jgi:Lon protease-like protein